jgi:S-DNA-T family DNA segregation ATPase FtsK/SpoIIIE
VNIGDWVVVPIVWLVQTIVILVLWACWHPLRVLAFAALVAVWQVLELLGFEVSLYDTVGLVLDFVVFACVWWAAAGVAGWFRRPKRKWAQKVVIAAGAWELVIGSWWRPFWRARYVYGRNWQESMEQAFLTIPRPRRIDKVPRIRKVVVGPFGDTVWVKMLKGQTVEQYERKAEAFAGDFGMQSVRVYPRYTEPGRWPLPGMVTVTDEDGTERRRPGIGKRKGGVRVPGQLVLECSTKDVLTEPLKPIPIPASVADVDFGAVPVGKTEAGETWTLKVHGNHILCAGVTGSGKGSIMWSVLKGLAPAIEAGLVQVWAIDPKGGMELFRGRPLYARYCDTTPAAMNAMLGELVVKVDKRTQKYKPQQREHVPTVEDPLILCVIDECSKLFVPLSALKADKDVANEAKARVTLLVNQGRAVGVSMLMLLQNPRKEVIDMRDEIPDRIALRLLSAQYGDMMFWQGAAASGIRCDRILRSQPGRGFAWNDKRRAIIAVRAAYVSDDEIAELVEGYAPGPRGEDLLDEIEASAT